MSAVLQTQLSPHREIRILSVTSLRGPNAWTYRPVLEALIDIGELEDFPSNTIPGFVDRLVDWVPTLIEHRCSYEVRGGFIRRLREGTWPGHILEHITLELQNLAGLPGGFGKARETSTRGVYKVVVRAWDENVTRAALIEARDLIMAAMDDQPFDVGEAVERLRELTDRHLLGPSTAAIVDAADDRDIPAIRLNEGNLMQLGYGAAQRRIWTAETDLTSAIAEGISRDKTLTKRLLRDCGLRVPEGEEVASAAKAWEVAQEIGLPVVVKPVDGNHGRGVATNLSTREQVEQAWAVAQDEGSGVIVEKFIQGNEHRLLVVGGRMVAATRGDIAIVTGNGRDTVRVLIEDQLNSDPRRGTTEDFPLNRVRIDSAATLELASQGLTPESVPALDAEVLIQRNGNMAFDVTDEVHPSIAADVVLAARAVGLDIAGIDLVAQDISRPLADQDGAIVEVNAGPGLLMHLKPVNGKGRPVGQAIVDHLFGPGDAGRIPVVGITGSDGTTPVARLVAHLLELTGRQVGLACQDGLFMARRQIETRPSDNWASAVRVLQNRGVEAAVFENGPLMMATEGLGYDRCAVGVVTGIARQAQMPAQYIDTADQVASVLRTQVDVVLPDGTAVLNADDDRVRAMAGFCDGEVIFYTANPEDPTVALTVGPHVAAGGKVVMVRNSHVIVAQGERRDFVATIRPEGREGMRLAEIGVGSMLAAIGAAIALDIPLPVIRAGIDTMVPDGSQPRYSLSY